ncbi:MAG TPA: type II toxin-antitoxin system VapC family toxin [Dehalococcoidia bacterium]|nr:type II toxin-antitoxin system VapC family toxin [Dehalococcoidia bacterium]
MIVADASLVVKLFLNEPDSQQVRTRWREWARMGEVVLAPALLWPETVSTLRRSVHRGILSEAEGDLAFGALEELEIDVREPAGLYRAAWALAQRFRRPTVYDCCYLALAEMAGCDLWTADQRLLNAVGASLPWVRSP